MRPKSIAPRRSSRPRRRATATRNAMRSARERLLADNAIAKRDYDEKQNAAREASANLKAAQAALETAQHQSGLHEDRGAGVGPRVARGNHGGQRRVGGRERAAADDARVGVADLRIVRRRRTDLPAIPEPRRQTAARCRCSSVSRTKSGYSRERHDRFGRQPARYVARARSACARVSTTRTARSMPGLVCAREGGRRRAASGAC